MDDRSSILSTPLTLVNEGGLPTFGRLGQFVASLPVHFVYPVHDQKESQHHGAGGERVIHPDGTMPEQRTGANGDPDNRNDQENNRSGWCVVRQFHRLSAGRICSGPRLDPLEGEGVANPSAEPI